MDHTETSKTSDSAVGITCRNPDAEKLIQERVPGIGRKRIQALTCTLAATWTLVVLLSLGWSLYQSRRDALAMALTAARINFAKDILYRRWATMHGGVYVPETPETPPNQYLAHLPERDLTTPSGRKLTLLNPAYMTRQVFTLNELESNIRGHITSLKPLRPENKPDAWEVQALKAFEQGKPEVTSVEKIDGMAYFRLMRPLFADKDCLNCHAQQGYKEGDIRGGISVAIPLAPIYVTQNRAYATIILRYMGLWMVGLLGINLGRRRLKTAWQEQEATDNALRQSNRHLQALVAQSERYNREISLVSSLSEQLHACMSNEEASRVINNMAPRLFPNYSGELYLLNASRHMLEKTLSWGEASPHQPIMEPQSCWALRRGHPYLVEDSELAPICEQLTPPYGGCFCIPLMAQSEALGVLHLRDPLMNSHQERGPSFPDATQKMILSVAGHIALSLGNLRLQETLRHQAIRDALTGLFNRRFMLETLERELYRMKREESPLSVIMMDIDHFKRFNDTFGHEAGDLLLSALGRLLQEKVRKEDVACRYGGEEFTIILPGTPLETAAKRAEDIRRAVHGLHLDYQGQSLGNISISLGVAVYPDHGEDPDVLLRSADTALYAAKNAGRDRVEVSMAEPT